MFDYLLPIGSVVRLKDGTKPLMVFGIKQIDPEQSATEYDYVSVPYPEGHLGIQNQYLFNHDDIKEILFRGFDSKERADFLLALDNYIKANADEKRE